MSQTAINGLSAVSKGADETLNDIQGRNAQEFKRAMEVDEEPPPPAIASTVMTSFDQIKLNLFK